MRVGRRYKLRASGQAKVNALEPGRLWVSVWDETADEGDAGICLRIRGDDAHAVVMDTDGDVYSDLCWDDDQDVDWYDSTYCLILDEDENDRVTAMLALAPEHVYAELQELWGNL